MLLKLKKYDKIQEDRGSWRNGFFHLNPKEIMNLNSYRFLYKDLTSLRHQYLATTGVLIDGKDFNYCFTFEGLFFVKLQEVLKLGTSVRSILGVDRFVSASVRSVSLRFYFLDGSTYDLEESNLQKEWISIPLMFRHRKILYVRYCVDHDYRIFNHPSLNVQGHIDNLRRDIKSHLTIDPSLPREILGLSANQDPLTWTPPEGVPLDFWVYFIRGIWGRDVKEVKKTLREYQSEIKLNKGTIAIFKELLSFKKDLIWKKDSEYFEDMISHDYISPLTLKNKLDIHLAYRALLKSLDRKDPVFFWDSIRKIS